jgi:hypothetical protein
LPQKTRVKCEHKQQHKNWPDQTAGLRRGVFSLGTAVSMFKREVVSSIHRPSYFVPIVTFAMQSHNARCGKKSVKHHRARAALVNCLVHRWSPQRRGEACVASRIGQPFTARPMKIVRCAVDVG